MLVLDGADIVLRGDIRLYMRTQAYYYNRKDYLASYPDGTPRRTKMYIHLGDLVLENNSQYSYRYLKNGNLVKTSSGAAEYNAHKDLYLDANEYGKVYFDADVYLHVSANTDDDARGAGGINSYAELGHTLRTLETYIPTVSGSTTVMGSTTRSDKIFSTGQVYLFRKEHTAGANVYTGVDLLGWYITVNPKNSQNVKNLRTALANSTFQFNQHTAADFKELTNADDKKHPDMSGLTEIVWE
jgi:hypothetical protein